MNEVRIFEIVIHLLEIMAKENPKYSFKLSGSLNDHTLDSLGLEVRSLNELMSRLEKRMDGRRLDLHRETNQILLNTWTIGDFVTQIRQAIRQNLKNPLIVYVDDEEENLLVFKRHFGKDFSIKTFLDPQESLEYIKIFEDVGLVITDEVMPGMSGNELYEKVNRVKPFLKFILMTGNPNNDRDLMLNALSEHRFYAYFQKPVDFMGDKKRLNDIFESLLSRISL